MSDLRDFVKLAGQRRFCHSVTIIGAPLLCLASETRRLTSLGRRSRQRTLDTRHPALT